jgi:hypothetical protein
LDVTRKVLAGISPADRPGVVGIRVPGRTENPDTRFWARISLLQEKAFLNGLASSTKLLAHFAKTLKSPFAAKRLVC